MSALMTSMLDTTTESSSALDRGCGGSDSSNSEGFYTRINAKEVDGYIQSIISTILPNLNAHLNSVLTAEFLTTLHDMILTQAALVPTIISSSSSSPQLPQQQQQQQLQQRHQLRRSLDLSSDGGNGARGVERKNNNDDVSDLTNPSSSFFRDQLGSILMDALAKFSGRKLRECLEDILADISELLFNEFAFFHLMKALSFHLIGV